MDSYSHAHVEAWLRGDVPFLHDAEEQDTDLILAGVHTSTTLCRLFDLPGALPERRDEIAMALCVQLEDLLRCQHEPANNVDVSADEIATFIRDHLETFMDGDARTGFGIGFEEVVLPYVTSAT